MKNFILLVVALFIFASCEDNTVYRVKQEVEEKDCEVTITTYIQWPNHKIVRDEYGNISYQASHFSYVICPVYEGIARKQLAFEKAQMEADKLNECAFKAWRVERYKSK